MKLKFSQVSEECSSLKILASENQLNLDLQVASLRELDTLKSELECKISELNSKIEEMNNELSTKDAKIQELNEKLSSKIIVEKPVDASNVLLTFEKLHESIKSKDLEIAQLRARELERSNVACLFVYYILSFSL